MMLENQLKRQEGVPLRHLEQSAQFDKVIDKKKAISLEEIETKLPYK
jgi:hypothetical protein